MKRFRTIPVALLVLAVLAALVLTMYRDRQARRATTQPFGSATSISGLTMGTIPFRLTAVGGEVGPDWAAKALRHAHEALERVNTVMSAYLPESNLSRLNSTRAGEEVELNKTLMTVLLEARRYTYLTDGAFDPTCGRLFALWKSAMESGNLPADEQVVAALAQTGWDKIELKEQTGTAVKSIDGLRIDLGAIAKGYAVDLAVESLRSAGLAGGLVEVGGEVRVFGPAPNGGAWLVGIQHPFRDTDRAGRPAFCGKLALSEVAVASSGNYQRFRVIAGKRYSHIDDPRTGRPAEKAPSVTVIAADCTTADIWATALSVLGPGGLEKIDQADGIEAMMIIGDASNYEVKATSGFGKYLHNGQAISLE
ncbi:MAG: FAD:protein FMN transferase [Planctomycetes bacterium]|nr:FAD:protein FMN transferase [Planctomycetota bacterium]